MGGQYANVSCWLKHETAWDSIEKWLVSMIQSRLFLLRDNNYTRCTFRFKTLQDVFIHLELTKNWIHCVTHCMKGNFSKIHNWGTLRIFLLRTTHHWKVFWRSKKWFFKGIMLKIPFWNLDLQGCRTFSLKNNNRKFWHNLLTFVSFRIHVLLYSVEHKWRNVTECPSCSFSYNDSSDHMLSSTKQHKLVYTGLTQVL